ncbi:tripeptide aminopeptidase [Elusimicrobium posterum]|uniref:peptidase T n=1 Tax=Elusimicrobium posterum TaxID=3116653 RepID=UPI003C77CB04
MDLKKTAEEYLIKYAKIKSMSDPESKTQPSTTAQIDFQKVLLADLKEIGVTNAQLDQYGFLMAEIPANNGKDKPAIGFIAHVDTVIDFTKEEIKPVIHRNYQGNKVAINEAKGLYLDPQLTPELKQCVGHDIVTSDGNTILGADDKSGVAVIFTMAKYLKEHPEIKHGPIKLAFTPDEEIGRGTVNFDIQKFGADFAYTIDGEGLDTLNNGNFNGDSFTINITGVYTHTGSAKDILVNPAIVAADIINSWDSKKLPETTEKEEGFIYFSDVTANSEGAVIKGILREHDLNKLYKMEDELKKLTEKIQAKHKGAVIKLEIKESYRNAKKVLAEHPAAMERIEKTLKRIKFDYKIEQIRGGSDGMILTLKGLPTPNIFAGYRNEHGPAEWVSLNAMENIVNIITELVKED